MSWKTILLALAVVGFAAHSEPPTAPPIDLLRVPHDGLQPQAILDSAGVLHLLYYSGDPKDGDLFYVRSTDSGGSWSAPLRVNSRRGTALALGTIRGGQMSLGRNGRVYVAWNGSSETQADGPWNPEAKQHGAPMLYSRLNDAGTAFEPERSLMTRTFGLDGGGAVASDAAGNVYVAWHGKAAGASAGEAGREVWIAASHDDGAHFAAEQPAWKEATGACGCCGLAIFADRSGAVHILYRSATENVHRDIFLLTSFDHARSFDGRKLHTWDINACPMSSMAFAEAGGSITGAWETGGQVYLQNLAEPKSAPLAAPGEGQNRKHPRLAMAPNGDLLLAWTEGTGWQRGGSLAWQRFSHGQPVGERRVQPGIPTWSFAAVVAKPAGGFAIIY